MCLNNTMCQCRQNRCQAVIALLWAFNTNPYFTVSGEVGHCRISHLKPNIHLLWTILAYQMFIYIVLMVMQLLRTQGQVRWTGETENMMTMGSLNDVCIKYTWTLPQSTLRTVGSYSSKSTYAYQHILLGIVKSKVLRSMNATVVRVWASYVPAMLALMAVKILFNCGGHLCHNL